MSSRALTPLIAAAALATLVACGSDDESTTSPPPTDIESSVAESSIAETSTPGSSTPETDVAESDLADENHDAAPDTTPITPATTERAVPAPEGVTGTVGFLGDRELVDPVRNEPTLFVVVIEGLDDLDGSEDLQISVDAEITNGVETGTYDQRERYDLDDVDSRGRLVHVITGVAYVETGVFPASVSGYFSIDGARAPFGEDLSVAIG